HKDIYYLFVDPWTTENQRDPRQAVAFAERLVGQAFGFGEMAAISVSLLSSRRLAFTRKSHLICSVLVARALERTDAVFELDPSAMLPADLAKHYGVKP